MLVLALVFVIQSQAQKGYDAYQKVDGMNISTKWGKAKDAEGVKRDALLFKLENSSDQAAVLSLSINFYYEGILRETGRIEGVCLNALKSSVGKLNGVYFIPEGFTPEQIKNSDFGFTLENIEVEKVDACP